VWGRGEVHVGFCWEDLRERDHLEDLGLDGKVMLEWTSKQSFWEDEDCIDLAWDRDKRRVLVTTAVFLRVP